MTVGIKARELYALQPDDEVCVACVSGSLWVTVDHDRRDIVLEDGQSWTIPARARCVIFALQHSDARLTIREQRLRSSSPEKSGQLVEIDAPRSSYR